MLRKTVCTWLCFGVIASSVMSNPASAQASGGDLYVRGSSGQIYRWTHDGSPLPRSAVERMQSRIVDLGDSVEWVIPDSQIIMACPDVGGWYIPCPEYSERIYNGCMASRVGDLRGISDRAVANAIEIIRRTCLDIAISPSVLDRLRY